jgi:hypothetical protein
MEGLLLGGMIGAIALTDHLLNGHWQLARRLLDTLDRHTSRPDADPHRPHS